MSVVRAGRSIAVRLARALQRWYARVATKWLPRRWAARVWHNPLFDADYYAAQVGGRSLSSPEQDYRRRGAAAGAEPNFAFRTDWYLSDNPDVAVGGWNPLDHYYLHGASEGRDPAPFFDTDWYLASNRDIATADINPLQHYLRHGHVEGRPTRDWWSPAAARPRPASTGRREITFFHVGTAEFQIVEPLAIEAADRGFAVRLTQDLRAAADIGFYCHHNPDPRNARFSVVMLHDLGQEFWPYTQTEAESLWTVSPWNTFDLGILPGPLWAEWWCRLAVDERARPRQGVFELGWPKADRVVAQPTVFKRELRQLRRRLGIDSRPVVLFAPSWDSPQKRDDFVTSLSGLPVNLLVKYEPEHALDGDEGLPDNVVVLDPKLSILYCLGLSDVIVSEESSCLVEALQFDLPGVAVSDWDIPELPSMGLPARPPEPPDFVTETDVAGLRSAVSEILADRDRFVALQRVERKRWFGDLAVAAPRILDTLEAALSGRDWPFAPLEPQETDLVDPTG